MTHASFIRRGAALLAIAILALFAYPVFAAQSAAPAVGSATGIYAPAISLSPAEREFLLFLAIAIALIGFALAEPNSARYLYDRVRRTRREEAARRESHLHA